ncbi:MAG TPA: hypothetical protein VMY37_20700 [Thermoguttaceae bacterium]|nr:hypothetical protein [Thermoguttaceae bacterium]
MMPDTDSLARVQQFLREVQTYQERLRAIPVPDRADPEELLRYLRELRQPTTPNLGQATLETVGRDLAELARLQRAFSVGDGLEMHAGPHGTHIAAVRSEPHQPHFGAEAGLWKWAQAKTVWDYFTGGATCYPATDCSGTTVDTETEFAVFFYSDALYEPNIRPGDMLAYVEQNYVSGGEILTNRYCVWGERMHESVGSVKLWNSVASYPPGWQLADGTNGTRDLRGRFVVGYHASADRGDADYNVVGNTGGGETHTHDNHANHNHTLAAGSGVGAGGDFSCSTGNESAALSHSTSNHRPPYYVLVWIERVD